MRLRPRLTLFTVSLVALVVAFTSVSTIVSLRYLLRQEMRANQVTLFNNFREACYDALYLGDDLGIKAYSESLEKSVPGLAFAVFVDRSRGISLGGIESLERLRRLKPLCAEDLPIVANQSRVHASDLTGPGNRWRFFCQPIELTNIQNKRIAGTAFVGFNVDFLEFELRSIVRRMWGTLGSSMIVVLGFGLAMAFFLSRRITKPINHLTEGAQAIGDGKLDTRIPIESTDELGFLAQEFNLMAAKLKELDQLKDDFISSVSHELRSPLSAISGYVELLRSKPIEDINPEKRTKALTIIQQSTERLAHFINDILDLAKLKSGHMELRLKELNIRESAEDLVGLFHPLFERKGVAAEIEIAPDVRSVEADVDKLRQVMTNLVSNALKFTPSGGKIGIIAKNQDDSLFVSVRDSGIGIPAEALESIFERFKQVDNARDLAGNQKGTGLGLAIARGIIEAHGGRIWIESEVGKGTTVHFTLPPQPPKKNGIV